LYIRNEWLRILGDDYIWRFPIKLSEDPCSIRGLPPRLGENTQKLLEEPDLSGQGILELADEGIF